MKYNRRRRFYNAIFATGYTIQGYTMPFTFSHPAIVLPLLNRNKSRILFSSTGLVIGSIIPDFESFIRFDQHKQYSHTWLGIFWFDLPLAILFSFIFSSICALIRFKMLDQSSKIFAIYVWVGSINELIATLYARQYHTILHKG